MSYWKSKVLPRLKKLLKKGPKSQAAGACKSFNKSKESLAKEIEEKKEELQPKVASIYRLSSIEAKNLLRDPTESGVVEYIDVVQNLLIELSDAGCPGAQTLSDAATKHGPGAIAESILFLLSKLTVFVAGEDAPTLEEPQKAKGCEVNTAVASEPAVAAETTNSGPPTYPTNAGAPEAPPS